MQESIGRMVREINETVEHGLYGVWLYGSVVMDDFRLGWSDIDFFALTEAPLTETQADRLLTLRQRLSKQETDNPYYRCFEGVIASFDEYRSDRCTRAVYWGTTGQRIVNRFGLDPFSRYELAVYSKPVFGGRDRGLFAVPDRAELNGAVRRHYEAIRSCAVQTDERLYSCGWLLDIARCIYTLRYGDVIAKTQAGEWALAERLFPDAEALEKTLEIRKKPLAYRDRDDIRSWLCGLGPTVQRCADVLENELRRCRC